MPNQAKLAEFIARVKQHLTGDEKGEAQLYLERLFQAFGHAGLKEAGATLEVRVAKAAEAGGGTAFADLVWKPVVLVEMKKRGTDLHKHYRQEFDYWSRLVPNRPRRPRRLQLRSEVRFARPTPPQPRRRRENRKPRTLAAPPACRPDSWDRRHR